MSKEPGIAVASRAIKEHTFLRDVMVARIWRSNFPVKHRVRVIVALSRSTCVHTEFKAVSVILELADPIDVMVHLELVKESYVGRTSRIARQLKTYRSINNTYSIPEWAFAEGNRER
jgi:hypothetical protein